MTTTQTKNENTPYVLSKTATADIDKWLAKFPNGNSRPVILRALWIVQEENGGWLSTDAMDAVADYLQQPKINVYEVAKFYSLYELEPVGKYKIHICTNISCMLNGSDEIESHLKNKLKINFNETTKDGKFTLKKAECLAACGGAPAMQINWKYYENLTPEKIDKILGKLE